MWRLIFMAFAAPAFADSVVATRPIAPNAVITADDVTLVAMDIPNAISQLGDAIGQTTAAKISAGRVLLSGQLTQSLEISRNAVVSLVLSYGGLEIRTEGRALTAGRVGDVIEVMNLSSRTRIRGQIDASGAVHVAAKPGLEK